MVGLILITAWFILSIISLIIVKTSEVNDVLNKVHHDIEYTTKYYPHTDHSDAYINVDDVYKILNKYRVEENKDEN